MGGVAIATHLIYFAEKAQQFPFQNLTLTPPQLCASIR